MDTDLHEENHSFLVLSFLVGLVLGCPSLSHKCSTFSRGPENGQPRFYLAHGLKLPEMSNPYSATLPFAEMNIVYFPLLVSKEICHCWTYVYLFQGA